MESIFKRNERVALRYEGALDRHYRGTDTRWQWQDLTDTPIRGRASAEEIGIPA
jgi:hypothetical protein